MWLCLLHILKQVCRERRVQEYTPRYLDSRDGWSPGPAQAPPPPSVHSSVSFIGTELIITILQVHTLPLQIFTLLC